ncbi:hypothetical protein T484DRAFT_1975465 [Baffinella frigidus]|nr:hypothetical protein T484DRAFT_1975465 [Cryptophyta sp. CCMP2293]
MSSLEQRSVALKNHGEDPLLAAREASKTAGGRADGGSSRPPIKARKTLDLDDSSGGRVVPWSDGEDDEEESSGKLQLNSPVAGGVKDRLSGFANPVFGQHSNKGPRVSAKGFSEEEIDFLIKGVKRFGKGKWKEILEAYEFRNNRSTVDVKDKWRNLEKTGRVPTT